MAEDMDLSTSEEDKTSSVHLRGELSEPPSRALWILKWFLAIPHIVVLAFLLVAVVFVTIYAFFVIIFTGKYPRSSFDFVVGVFRWGWRVEFYAFSVLGTDKYPPFSLKPQEDYPADFHIDYSERLKQWLPLVKWFLAIPHYFVVIAFIGSSGNNDVNMIPVMNPFDMDISHLGNDGFPGLRLILLVIVLIALLFTGRYHKDIFRLVMGINRWIYRTAAYVFLLTDEYPHFRLVD